MLIDLVCKVVDGDWDTFKNTLDDDGTGLKKLL